MHTLVSVLWRTGLLLLLELGVLWACARFFTVHQVPPWCARREGELLGLRWQDVDLERKSLTVRMSVQETATVYVLAEPKTKGSRRTIGLTSMALDALKAHRVRQHAERLTLGPAWSDQGLVFPSTIGCLMIPHNLAKRGFKQVLRRAGLPGDLHFHCLRHTAATLLISRGVDAKTVSEMLGHADIAITLRVYTHVTPHTQQAAVDVMQRVFGG